jgi:DNA-binding response OmpR family regulator
VLVVETGVRAPLSWVTDLNRMKRKRQYSTAPRAKVVIGTPRKSERELIVRWCATAGFTPHAYRTARDWMAGVRSRAAVLAVINARFASGAGLELVREARARGADTPILVIAEGTASPSPRAIFEAGATDFVTRPYDYAELAARAEARIGVHTASPGPLLRWGPVSVDLATTETRVLKRVVCLTRMQQKLLLCLIRASGRVVSHEEISKQVLPRCGPPPQVRRLVHLVREKLAAAGCGDAIATVRGRGFRMASVRGPG